MPNPPGTTPKVNSMSRLQTGELVWYLQVHVYDEIYADSLALLYPLSFEGHSPIRYSQWYFRNSESSDFAKSGAEKCAEVFKQRCCPLRGVFKLKLSLEGW